MQWDRTTNISLVTFPESKLRVLSEVIVSGVGFRRPELEYPSAWVEMPVRRMDEDIRIEFGNLLIYSMIRHFFCQKGFTTLFRLVRGV